jgi:hypothetical protein
MPQSYEAYRGGEVDSKFIVNVRKALGNITALKSPLFQKVKQFARTEVTGPAGIEFRQYDYHSVQAKFGSSDMDFPNRSQFHVGAYRQISTWVYLTYAIDQATKRAYDSQDKGALVKMSEELKMLAQGLGWLQDFYLATSDASGRLAVVSGSPSTTSMPLSTTWNGTPGNGNGAAMITAEVDYDEVNPTTRVVNNTFRIAYVDRGNINRTTNTITFNTALANTPVAGNIIVPKGSAFQMPYGLPILVSGSKTGIWQAKNVTGSYEDQSMTLDAQQSALNNWILERINAKQRLRQGSADDVPFAILTAFAERLEYIRSAWAMFMINNGQGDTLDTTVKNARYRGVGFEEYPPIDADRMYLTNLSDFIYCDEQQPGIISTDGLVWRQMAAQSGQYGSGRWYTNYGTGYNWMLENPQNQAVVTNLYVDPASPTLANYYTAN